MRQGTRCNFGLDITTLGYLAEPNSAVFGSIARGNILGFVGRAKVNDNEFKVAKGLAEDAFDRLSQKSLYIANYHHDRNERSPHCFHILATRSVEYQISELTHPLFDVEGLTYRFAGSACHPATLVGMSRKVQDCLNESGKALKGSKILLFGLSYKADVDDMRESPSLELIRLLEDKGAETHYHDPFIPEIGPSREYAHLAGRRSCQPSNAYDCFIIVTRHNCFNPENILSFNVPVVDTRNLMPRHPSVYLA